MLSKTYVHSSHLYLPVLVLMLVFKSLTTFDSHMEVPRCKKITARESESIEGRLPIHSFPRCMAHLIAPLRRFSARTYLINRIIGVRAWLHA